MTRSTLWLAAILALGGAMAAGAHCGDDDDPATDDGGTDDTTTDDTTGDTGERCNDFPADPAIPEMRLRTMNVTAPAAMQNAILQSLINDSMNSEPPLFVWLLRFEGVGTGTIELQTGSGTLADGMDCTFDFLDPDYPSSTITMTETGSEFALSGAAIPRLDVPLWSTGTAYPDAPLLVMPLREVSFGGEFDADHLYIGSYDSGMEEWTDGGTITGKITVDDAKAVVIEDLGMTLCGLLSGDTGAAGNPADDCDDADPTGWTRPPDTTVGSDPAYSMSATFAAAAVYINE